MSLRIWIKVKWWSLWSKEMWDLRIATLWIKYPWFFSLHSWWRKHLGSTYSVFKDGTVWRKHRYKFWRPAENVGTYGKGWMMLK